MYVIHCTWYIIITACPEFDCVFQVELDISSIHFLHHPLFSFEHVLSSQLEEAYQKYSNWDKNAEEYYYLKVGGKVYNIKGTYCCEC